ncbi:hypothetical protein ACIQXD_29475 [Streptomyces uncialis]|uniref:hypothetical protein n=1 Tax=Streptomyces uncialis TaxID=1048205 RepID=UPI003806242A
MTIQQLATALDQSDIQGVEDPAPVQVFGDKILYIPFPDTTDRIKVTTWTGPRDVALTHIEVSLISRTVGVVDILTLGYREPDVSAAVADLQAFAALWSL